MCSLTAGASLQPNSNSLLVGGNIGSGLINSNNSEMTNNGIKYNQNNSTSDHNYMGGRHDTPNLDDLDSLVSLASSADSDSLVTPPSSSSSPLHLQSGNMYDHQQLMRGFSDMASPSHFVSTFQRSHCLDSQSSIPISETIHYVRKIISK